MQRQRHAIKDNLEDLVEDTRALLAATADVAGEKVAAARERVTSALEAAQQTYVDAQKNAVAGAQAADRVIRGHPYQSIVIAFGFGAFVGLLLGRRQ